MNDWKKVVLSSAVFGASFALICCFLIGGFSWYTSRPKPWVSNMVVAQYDSVSVTGEDDHLSFWYVLENKSNHDYKIDAESDIAISGYLGEQKSLTTADAALKLELPIFIPMGHRQRVKVNLLYSYPSPPKQNQSKEERKKFRASVEKYLAEELQNLDGFVLFDRRSRFEIRLPAGWKKGT